jgi:transcriptional regulator GlxA family with amidase domain
MHIVLPIYPRFTALDAVGPYEVLARLPGAEITFAAQAPGPVIDTTALSLVATAALGDIDGCDVVVVPGGPASHLMDEDDPVVRWVRRVHDTTAWTTSVCTGSLVLGAAGLLDGLTATTHWAAAARLETFGARYSEQRVVRAGRIMTAAGVSAGIDMALTLAGLLAGEEVARAIQLSIEYDPQPPYDSGSPARAGAQTTELVRTLIAARARA